MALDRPEHSLAQSQDNSAWTRELRDSSAVVRVNDVFKLESLGFPKLATEQLTDQSAALEHSHGRQTTSPDERVRDRKDSPDQARPADEHVRGGKYPINDQIRTPDERVHSNKWDPYEALSEGTFANFLENKSSYTGAEIHLKVDPTLYTVKTNETLERIAEKHLGPSATHQQVLDHALEISGLNHLTKGKSEIPLQPTDIVKHGKHLVLPGHDKDGGKIFTDAEGTKYTYSLDGRKKVEYKDGSGYERSPGEQGGYSDHHFGKRPEDNFDVKVGAESYN